MKRHGPVPTGRWPNSAGTAAGTTEATGIARNLGKTASGSVNVKATAVSPRTAMPLTSRARPSAKSAAPRRIQHPQQRAFYIRGDERTAVMKGDTGAQMEDVALGGSIGGPAVGQSGQQLAVGVELRQPVEQQRHHFAGRHVGGECRIERARIVRLVVDEPPPPSLVAAAGSMTGGEKTEEQGVLGGVEKVDSTVQVSQHSRDW